MGEREQQLAVQKSGACGIRRLCCADAWVLSSSKHAQLLMQSRGQAEDDAGKQPASTLTVHVAPVQQCAHKVQALAAHRQLQQRHAGGAHAHHIHLRSIGWRTKCRVTMTQMSARQGTGVSSMGSRARGNPALQPLIGMAG